MTEREAARDRDRLQSGISDKMPKLEGRHRSSQSGGQKSEERRERNAESREETIVHPFLTHHVSDQILAVSM